MRSPLSFRYNLVSLMNKPQPFKHVPKVEEYWDEAKGCDSEELIIEAIYVLTQEMDFEKDDPGTLETNKRAVIKLLEMALE